MVTLDRLKYFSEAAKYEHVGQAAKNLAISPSVISSAIKVLEEEFGCKLFSRNKNQLSLNENGHLLFEKSKLILAKTENLYNQIGSLNYKIKGHFKISASPFLMANFLVDSVTQIHKKHSDITCELLSQDTGIAVSKVLSGAIDMALVFRSFQHQDIEEHEVYQANFKVAVRKGHPILKTAKKNVITELNILNAITFRSSDGINYTENHPIFKKLGINPKHTYFYNNNQTSVQLLKSTDGWALLPDLVIEKNKRTISPLNISKEFNIPMKVSLIKNKNSSSSQLFDLIKEDLRLKLANVYN